MVEKTEDAKYVAPKLNSYFIKPICVLNMFKISFRNSLKVFDQGESPNNFGFYFV